MQAEQDVGSEIVLHGYAHRRSGSWQRPRRRQLRAQVFAPGDAEFLSLTPVEIESRLVSGRAIIEGAGLALHGFCAPGWIESGDVRAALQRTGFRYDIAMTHIVDLYSRRRIWMDWVGYMGAGGVQENLVGIANAINRSAMPLFGCAKLFLHPQRARGTQGAARMLRWLERLMRERSLATYIELLSVSS